MSEEFSREERAFAEALRSAVADQGFRPLDPDAVKAVAGPPRSSGGPWVKGLAAAAVVVVALGVGTALLPRSGAGVAASEPMAGAPAPAGGAAPMDASPAESGPVQTDRVGSEPGTGPAAGPGPLAPAAPGMRWESFRDVAVQVPQEWDYAASAGPAHCISKDLPRRPHVDLNRGGELVPAILCPELDDDRQVLHLSFTPAAYPEPVAAPGSTWRPYTVVLGEARITVVARDSDAALAERILATATVVPHGLDPNGCPVRRDPVPAVDLTGLDGSALAVCQYDATEAGDLLRASVHLDGDRARAAWRAVLAAPGGGGPDESAQDCLDIPGSPLLLLVGATRVPVAGTVVACRGNGVADAGAAGGLREITRDLCRGLLVEPVRLTGGPGEPGRRCLG